MTRSRPLFTSDLVNILVNDHPPGAPHRDPREETAPDHIVSFVMRGAFTVARGRRRWRLTPGELFITRPGFTYQCAHDETAPEDVCLSIVCGPALAGRAEAAAPLRAGRPTAPLSNRLAYLRHRLERSLAQEAGALAMESIAAETLEALACPSGRLHPEPLLRWYAGRVDAARELLDSACAEPHSLGSLSRQVGMSPFHFNRVFRQLAGTPPHRYLMQVRLRQAASRLRAGDSVTGAALASGFNNLSHFTRLFARYHGMPPSRYARVPVRSLSD